MMVENRWPSVDEIETAIRCLIPNDLVVRTHEGGKTVQRLRDDVLAWMDDNVKGAVGFHYIPAGFRYDCMEHIPMPRIINQDDPVNAIWFMDEMSAIHFKMRWWS
jgi:hypothetical protein